MFSQNILWLPLLKHFIIKLFLFYLLRHSIRRIKIWLGERLPFGFLLLIFSEREKRFSYISPQVSFLFRNIFRLYPYHCHSKEKCIFEGNTQKCTHAMFILATHFIAFCAPIMRDELRLCCSFSRCRVYCLVSSVNACAVEA